MYKILPIQKELILLANEALVESINALNSSRNAFLTKESSQRRELQSEISSYEQELRNNKNILKEASIVELDEDSEEVQIGSSVVLTFDGDEEECFIVIEENYGGALRLEDFNFVSINSPVGKKILGKKVGDKVNVTFTANGKKIGYDVSIVNVCNRHESTILKKKND